MLVAAGLEGKKLPEPTTEDGADPESSVDGAADREAKSVVGNLFPLTEKDDGTGTSKIDVLVVAIGVRVIVHGMEDG